MLEDVNDNSLGVFGALPEEVFYPVLAYLTMRELYLLGRTGRTMNRAIYDGAFFKFQPNAKFPPYLQSDFVESVKEGVTLRRFFADAKNFMVPLRKLARNKKALDALGQINTQGTVTMWADRIKRGYVVDQALLVRVRDTFFELFPERDIPAFSPEVMNRITAQIADVSVMFMMGHITLPQLAALPSIEHLDAVLSNGQGKALIASGLMTVEQLSKLSIPRMRFLLNQNAARHNITFHAFEDKILTGDDVQNMPTDTHVEYLTAQRETTTDYPRTFDGCGIHLIRQGYLSVQQFSQLPRTHLIELFNGRNGQGMDAFARGAITFDEIMAQPVSHLSEQALVNGEGKLAQFVRGKINQIRVREVHQL